MCMLPKEVFPPDSCGYLAILCLFLQPTNLQAAGKDTSPMMRLGCSPVVLHSNSLWTFHSKIQCSVHISIFLSQIKSPVYCFNSDSYWLSRSVSSVQIFDVAHVHSSNCPLPTSTRVKNWKRDWKPIQKTCNSIGAVFEAKGVWTYVTGTESNVSCCGWKMKHMKARSGKQTFKGRRKGIIVTLLILYKKLVEP